MKPSVLSLSINNHLPTKAIQSCPFKSSPYSSYCFETNPKYYIPLWVNFLISVSKRWVLFSPHHSHKTNITVKKKSSKSSNFQSGFRCPIILKFMTYFNMFLWPTLCVFYKPEVGSRLWIKILVWCVCMCICGCVMLAFGVHCLHGLIRH